MINSKQCRAKGGKFEDGKCFFPKKIKKYYNPFKMFGSYLLAVIFPSLWYIIFKIEAQKSYHIGMAILPAIIVGILLIPIGFLVGWCIHLLIRKFKKMNIFKKLWFWILIIGALLLIIIPLLINLSRPIKNLPDKAIDHITSLSENNPDDVEFLKASWIDIKDRYQGKRRCWRNYFWRNWIYNGKKVWNLENDCLPCHIYNNLFMAYLLESKRFNESQIETITTICWEVPMLHVYTKIVLDNGTKVNIDSWGADFGVNFMNTILDTETCNK